MATQQSISQFIGQSKLIAVSFPAPQDITLRELATLLSLSGRLHHLQQQVESGQQSIKSRLAAGASLEPGDHRAKLKGNFRRSVSWKDVVVRLAGRLSNGAHE